MSEQNNENEYTPDLYTLVDEEGKEQVFEMLDAIEVDDQRYFALIPYQSEPEETLNDDGDLVILKSEMVDGEEMLASIDDDEEFNRIGDIFLKRIEEMFDEECDCEECDCEDGCECGEHCDCSEHD